LGRVGRWLGTAVIALAAVRVGTFLLLEEVRGIAAVFDVLILGVALAVAAVPEGLPAVVTAVLALGVQRMAQRNAIVRRLAAVETLGSANVIASDKTGTLTRNEMTVRAVVTASGRTDLSGAGYEPVGEVIFRPFRTEDGQTSSSEEALREELRLALAVGDRANNAALVREGDTWSIQGDPTEGALIVAARKAGLASETLDARFERIGEVPFSSERKLMSTIHADAERDGHVRVFTKGAPDVLLTRCSREAVGLDSRPLTESRRAEILRANEALAREAMRTLGVAFREMHTSGYDGNSSPALEHELTFAGLIGMLDPPREEAKHAVERAKAAGIRPLMITGDHPITGSVIAAELGIAADDRTVTGVQLESMSDEERDRTVREVSVYARVD